MTWNEYWEIVLAGASLAFRVTALQYLWFMVPLILLGLIAETLSRMTRNIAVTSRIQGPHFTRVTGWIGVPIHEIGHALFAILFGHRLRTIQLFNSRATDREPLGYVTYSYNRQSMRQVAGTFFVGIGPLVFGSLIVMLMLRLLVPGSATIVGSITSIPIAPSIDAPLREAAYFGIEVIGGIARQTAALLVSPSSFIKPGFWLFLYIAFCVSAYMSLSFMDLLPLGGVAGVIPAFMCLINTLIVALSSVSGASGGSIDFRIDIETYAAGTIRSLSALAGTLTVSAVVAVGSFLFFYAAMLVYSFLRYREIPKPWR